jgi:hypothetical protein
MIAFVPTAIVPSGAAMIVAVAISRSSRRYSFSVSKNATPHPPYSSTKYEVGSTNPR